METDQIRICDFTIYNGRNIYSHRPVMKMVVDIGKYEDIPTNRIPGFNEKLLSCFPGLQTNCCGLGYKGGFMDRLKEGTYLAHVLEHTVLEMQYMAGYDVHFGRTRTIEPSRYYLVYEFENEVCGLECGKAAVFILNCILSGQELNLKEYFEYLKKVSLDAELGPSTTAIVEAAKRRGIPVTRIGNESLVRLGYGRHSRLIESTLTDATPCIAADISCNKQLTKFLLSEHQIPVPYGKVVYSDISALMVAGQIGKPVVVKPFDGNQGKGVHLNLKTDEEIRAAFQEASNFSSGIIVEKFVAGRDFRLLVVGGKLRAAAERLPACVTGDGIHTIRELIEIKNQDPNRGEQHEKPLTKIRLDNVGLNVLKKHGLTEDSVPAAGRTVVLRENGNLSTGGTAIDCTDEVHPENAEIAVQAAGALGIDIAGVDIVATDISKSILDTGGAVVEVNTAPGIRMHLYPSSGKPRSVADDIVGHLFPSKDTTQFPIVSVTGTNGKTTVVRLIAHTLALTGRNVGMTSTGGTFIGNKCVCKGDNSGPRSARSLLSNKTIDAAVLETARGGIVREGLGYDLADVGVITNISEDHLGLNGVNTLEDLAYVKSLVAEAVKEDGAAVLNGEDAMTPFILNRLKGRKTILFYKNGIARRTPPPGSVRVFTEEGIIRIEDGGKRTDVVKIEEIPITSGGRIECNVENSLAAVSALYALKVGAKTIRKGLTGFIDNTGRFHRYDYNGIQVVLDYGHNLSGVDQAIRACRRFGGRRLIGVIGMPGDRQDTAMQAVGRLCAGNFHHIFIKEDADRRGREEGEVARIFLDSILKSGYREENVEIELSERDAFQKALRFAAPGDLVVIFYEKLEPLLSYLDSVNATELTDRPFPEICLKGVS